MNEPGIEKITEMVARITGHMHIQCQVAIDRGSGDEQSPIVVSLRTEEDAKFLIGKNGQNLKALEHIVRAAYNRAEPAGRSVVVDVNDYRKVKTQQLVQTVREAAGRVRDSGRPEALAPMSSYERRLVHTELASWSDLATESVGQEPQRRVVIKPL